jgi:CYTH domain-containing protein
MTVVRRFLVAPSLVRLIRKERGASRVTEGYFPPQAGRTSLVRVDGAQCHLVLVTADEAGGSGEERTEVPRAHGDALLDVCAGKAAYDRTVVALGGGREAQVDRYATPGALDLISVTFGDGDEAAGFSPPAWFGQEVTADYAYLGPSIALQGVPQPGEVALSNAALDAVLDLVEHRYGFGRYGAPRTEDANTVANALRRLATPRPAAETPAAPAAAPAATTEEGGDARIDDVIESLSQALGAAVPGEGNREEGAPAFERWTVRPRRTNQPT